MLAKQIFALTIALAAHTAHAADLPVRGRIGALFDEHPIAVTARPAPAESVIVAARSVRTSPKLPGYYGAPGDFLYQSYYGTNPSIIFERLPYACGWYALC